MSVTDVSTGQKRAYTTQEQAAIDAARAAYVPQVPESVPVTDLLASMVAAGALTQARMDNILNRLKR